MNPPAWVEGYRGKPFRRGAEGPEAYDCYGLVRAVLRERFGVEAPAIEDAHLLATPERIAAAIDAPDSPWEQHQVPRAGDVLTFEGREELHVGLVVAPGYMLHATGDEGVFVSRYDRGRWLRARVGPAFRHRDLLAVLLVPSPLESERRTVVIGCGPTLGAIVDGVGIPREQLSVAVNGVPAPPGSWDTTPPPAGSVVSVVRRPGWEVAAAIAAYALSTLGGGWLAVTIAGVLYYAIGIGIYYGLSLLAQAINRPSTPDAATAAPGVRRTIAGEGNRLARYETGPQVLGRQRFFPPNCAASYTTVEDGALYQHSLFTFGYGPVALSEFKIADEPMFREDTAVSYTGQMGVDVDAFTHLKDGVRKVTSWIEVRQGTLTDEPIELFATDVQETVVGVEIRKADSALIRTTIDGITQFTVVVGFHAGLVWIPATGAAKETIVRIAIRYRLVGATAWIEVDNLRCVGSDRTSRYFSRTVQHLAAGQYEVAVSRITAAASALGVIDESHWTSLLVVRPGPVVVPQGLCLVAMKMKITGNFSTATNEFNAIGQTIAPEWDSGTGTWITRETSQNAALFRHVLQGRANPEPVADAEIDLAELADWAEECEDEGFEFNSITQGRQTVRKVLEQIAAAGRASVGLSRGLFSVVRENDLSGAPLHLAARDVSNFKGQRVYPELPHGWKVQYVDRESGWLDTDRLVLDDGYTEETATKFERLDLAGITSSDQAYKLGRYHLAQIRLRPEVYEFDMDWKSIEFIRGSWVKVNHDVPLFGLANGRVVSVALNGGGDAVSVVVDQECPMAAASYAVRFQRGSDGVSVYAPVNAVVGQQTTLTFTAPILAAAPKPSAGDLFLFGEAGEESVDLVVQDIEPLDEYRAVVRCRDAAPAVLTAANGPIPAYDPQISIPPTRQAMRPHYVRIQEMISSGELVRDASGTWQQPGILVRLGPRGAEVSR